MIEQLKAGLAAAPDNPFLQGHVEALDQARGSQLVRVRYYTGNVYLGTAVGFRPIISAQAEGSFEGAARAVALRRFGAGDHAIRPATAVEASADPAIEPSARVSRGLIEQRYYVVTPAA